jgi:hypothetical protein
MRPAYSVGVNPGVMFDFSLPNNPGWPRSPRSFANRPAWNSAFIRRVRPAIVRSGLFSWALVTPTWCSSDGWRGDDILVFYRI